MADSSTSLHHTMTSSKDSRLDSERCRSSAADTVEPNELDVPATASTPQSSLDCDTDIIRKLDIGSETELKNETIPTPTDATTIKTSTPNPYHNWECGFEFFGKFDVPETVPSTKVEFVKAANGEIATIESLQNGFDSYLKAVNSGTHYVFEGEFLKSQNDAAHKTIGQLFRIVKNLQHAIKEVEATEDDSDEVADELKEALTHALPWIRRARAILISSHVFYKINYVLGSDKTKNGH